MDPDDFDEPGATSMKCGYFGCTREDAADRDGIFACPRHAVALRRAERRTRGGPMRALLLIEGRDASVRNSMSGSKKTAEEVGLEAAFSAFFQQQPALAMLDNIPIPRNIIGMAFGQAFAKIFSPLGIAEATSAAILSTATVNTGEEISVDSSDRTEPSPAVSEENAP